MIGDNQRREVEGKSGRTNTAMRATKVVKTPSMKNSLSKLDCVDLAVKEGGNAPSPRSMSQNAFHTIEDPESNEWAEIITRRTIAHKESGP